MNIYYLASLKEETQSGIPRYLWEKADKETVLKKCWLSLQESISEEDRIFLIDSNLPTKLLKWITDRSIGLITHIKVPNTNKALQLSPGKLEAGGVGSIALRQLVT